MINVSVDSEFDPTIGYYNASSTLYFALSGFSQVAGGVPEPAVWALMLVGAGSLGGSLRVRRRAAVA